MIGHRCYLLSVLVCLGDSTALNKYARFVTRFATRHDLAGSSVLIMSEAELVPFPVLPVELILLIFEHLVLPNPYSALDLVLVSKSIQEL